MCVIYFLYFVVFFFLRFKSIVDFLHEVTPFVTGDKESKYLKYRQKKHSKLVLTTGTFMGPEFTLKL